MIHVNVIPLNPTGGFQGSPSGRTRVNEFISVLENEFGISTTPRVRRGIDIDAGCGQLKTKIEEKNKQDGTVVKELKDFLEQAKPPMVGVYEDDASDDEEDEIAQQDNDATPPQSKQIVEFAVDEAAVDFDSDDYIDPEFDNEYEKEEAARLVSLVQDSFSSQPTIAAKTTSIVNDDAIREAKRRRKKLLKNLKAVGKLKEIQDGGRELSAEQLTKLSREDEWKAELESVQHNLQ